MKIENLVEKDTVLDNDYLIVDGTDGTKKAKKSNFLKELNSNFESGVKIKNVVVVTRNITINSNYSGWEPLSYTFPIPLSDVYAGLTGVNPASGKTAQFFVNPSGNLVCATAMTNEDYGSWSISGAYVAKS